MTQSDPEGAAGEEKRRNLLSSLRALIYNHWLLLYIALVSGVLIAGTYGFYSCTIPNRALSNWDVSEMLLHSFYSTLQLFVMETGRLDGLIEKGGIPLELHVVRLVAPALLAGVPILAFLGLCRNQVDMLRAARSKNHFVVCGLGEMGATFALNAAKSDNVVVAIEKNASNNNIQRCRDNGVIVLIGDATDPAALSRARVPQCKYVFSYCSDPVNAEVAARGKRLVRQTQRNRGLPATSGAKNPSFFIHISSAELCKLLQERELLSFDESSPWTEFLNIFDAGAKLLWDEQPAFGHPPLLDSRRAHIAIVGCDPFSASLVRHMAEKWRLTRPDVEMKLPVTLVDVQAGAWTNDLMTRHPILGELLHCIPYDRSLSSGDFERDAFTRSGHGIPSVSTVYVCLEDESEALAVSLIVQRRLWLLSSGATVHVRLKSLHGLAELATKGEGSRTGVGLQPFGLIDAFCTPAVVHNTDLEKLARAIHGHYLDNVGQVETKGSPRALVPWERLPDDLKYSNRLQARSIRSRLMSVGCDVRERQSEKASTFTFTEDEIEVMAGLEHERWARERRMAGYVYGELRDDDGKPRTHPCLVPYEELPEHEKEKDRMACREIPEVLALIGYEVYKTSEGTNET